MRYEDLNGRVGGKRRKNCVVAELRREMYLR
nr:MAG TPA: hypothetical protein [Caudoviricetes sp.]